MAPRLRDTLI